MNGSVFFAKCIFWAVKTFKCTFCLDLAVLQDEQEWTSVPSRLFVCWGPAPRCYRGHALPKIFSCWTHHVYPCVPWRHNPQISGIRLHKLPATSWWYNTPSAFTYNLINRVNKLHHRRKLSVFFEFGSCLCGGYLAKILQTIPEILLCSCWETQVAAFNATQKAALWLRAQSEKGRRP